LFAIFGENGLARQRADSLAARERKKRKTIPAATCRAGLSRRSVTKTEASAKVEKAQDAQNF
jgi:hypothetical protein